MSASQFSQHIPTWGTHSATSSYEASAQGTTGVHTLAFNPNAHSGAVGPLMSLNHPASGGIDPITHPTLDSNSHTGSITFTAPDGAHTVHFTHIPDGVTYDAHSIQNGELAFKDAAGNQYLLEVRQSPFGTP